MTKFEADKAWANLPHASFKQPPRTKQLRAALNMLRQAMDVLLPDHSDERSCLCKKVFPAGRCPYCLLVLEWQGTANEKQAAQSGTPEVTK